MRKSVFPRILWFLLLNCVVFILLVMMQFSRRGNFSQKIGDMRISGRYSAETNTSSGQRAVDGNPSVVFGGLEFRLSSATGLHLVDTQERRHHVSPEFLAITEDGAVFTLSGGTEISFISQNISGTPELYISGKFAPDVFSVEIPFRTQRSSAIHNNKNNSLSILYDGNYYQFNRSMSGLESGQLVLLASAPVISYRMLGDKKEFNPADFILPYAETTQAFSAGFSPWVSRNFALWSEMGPETDEDTVIAWCGEAARQGTYRSAVSVIPVSFSSSPLRTWESAVYQFDRIIGVWERASRTIGAFEREQTSRISRLLEEKNGGLFTENHPVEFLAIRDNNQLIDDIVSFVRETADFAITLEMSPGILENCLDFNMWRPDTENPFEELVQRVYQLIAGSLYRFEDRMYVFSNGRADTAFNIRLGKALREWGEKSGNNEWAALGRSLILSVVALSDNDGSIPAAMVIDGGGGFTPLEGRISSAKIYRLIYNNEYLPHWTATGADGIWAWTAASSVNITQNNTFTDILIRFPVGETHYVMLQNIRPFPLLQIYEMNWRMAFDFESYYNASGWYYFEREQILVLKINQRSNVETVRIYYTVPRAPEPEPPAEPELPASAYPTEKQYQY